MKDETRRLFRLRPEPVRAIVAKARIDGGVALESCAPKRVHVPAGQALEIVFPYQLREASSTRESYTLRLSSHIGVLAMPHQEQKWGDRWGWPEALGGFLHQRYRLEPGNHQLQFTVEAIYRTQPWSGGDASLPQSKRVEGILEVAIG